MNLSRLSPRLISAILIFLFFGVALYIRVYFPHEQVFGSDQIKFTSPDAYYHMRLVDNLVEHFPHRITFDPYVNFPGTKFVDLPPFFHWLLGGVIWVIGLGSPTQHTVDVIGVYFPAILGALTVIPVYFIGKELFGRWAGVISAGLLAVLPGEFLGRSILGFTDHHVAEWLFTAIAMMFLILAIKAARERQLTTRHLRQWDWATLSRPVIYSLLAGLFLGIYLISWVGALLFVFIIAAYFIIQFIIDHLRRQSTDYLCLVGAVLFFIALVISAPVVRNAPNIASLVIALLIPIVMSIVSQLITRRGIRPAYYPLALLGLGGVGLVIFRFIAPSLWNTMWSQFSMFVWNSSATIIEMQPLLFPLGNFSLLLPWKMFYSSFFIGLISIGFLIYLVIRRGSADKNVLLVWSLVILAATLGQRRFAYYFAVNVALLTGYLSWLLLKVTGFREAEVVPVETQKTVTGKKARPRKRYDDDTQRAIRYTNMTLAVIVIFFLVFYFNIIPAKTVAEQARFAPTDAWCSSLTWLRENTPEPFDDTGYYYHLYQAPVPGEQYKHPESAYAVTAWGDYGYWILRIAHRLPNRTPGPGGESVAQFFVSLDEDSGRAMAQKLGTSYVMIDKETTTDKFYAIAQWAGLDKSQFYDYYFFKQEENRLVRGVLFYPDYYRSLVVRLYNFDGQAITAGVSRVISYEEITLPDGQSAKVITDVQAFPSYEEAVAYISSQESGNYRIVSDSPFSSPISLDALEDYRLIHSSEEETVVSGVEVAVPEVKIFEYIGME